MEYLGGGHRVGALGSEERRGQGELPGEVGLDWTSKDGQNLNRWSPFPYQTLSSEAWDLSVRGQLVGVSLGPELPHPPAVSACREFFFFCSGRGTMAAP